MMRNQPATVPPTPPLQSIPPREHNDLTAIGKTTREGLYDSMAKGNRFFHLYSRQGSCRPDKGLGGTDIVAFFHPFLRNLKHIDIINSETVGYNPDTDKAWVGAYKQRVTYCN